MAFFWSFLYYILRNRGERVEYRVTGIVAGLFIFVCVIVFADI